MVFHWPLSLFRTFFDYLLQLYITENRRKNTTFSYTSLNTVCLRCFTSQQKLLWALGCYQCWTVACWTFWKLFMFWLSIISVYWTSNVNLDHSFKFQTIVTLLLVYKWPVVKRVSINQSLWNLHLKILMYSILQYNLQLVKSIC